MGAVLRRRLETSDIAFRVPLEGTRDGEVGRWRYPTGYTNMEETVELPIEVVDDLRKRLRRAGGQVQAVERMLADGRECRDIVTQISAATKALEQVGFRLIASGLTYCLEHPDEAAAAGYPIDEVQRMFTKLA